MIWKLPREDMTIQFWFLYSLRHLTVEKKYFNKLINIYLISNKIDID